MPLQCSYPTCSLCLFNSLSFRNNHSFIHSRLSIAGSSAKCTLVRTPPKNLPDSPSATCISVQKLHAILPNTPGDLTSSSNYFQTLPDPLEVSNVLSDSARAYSGAPVSTGSYGGAFRMLHRGWSSFGAPVTPGQICGRVRQKLKLLQSSVGYLESGQDCCTARQETWSRILTAVVLT